LSPDGTRLAWLAWDHPNMPWTASTLYMVALDDAGIPTCKPTEIAGGDEVSLFQLRAPDDRDQLLRLIATSRSD